MQCTTPHGHTPLHSSTPSASRSRAFARDRYRPPKSMFIVSPFHSPDTPNQPRHLRSIPWYLFCFYPFASFALSRMTDRMTLVAYYDVSLASGYARFACTCIMLGDYFLLLLCFFGTCVVFIIHIKKNILRISFRLNLSEGICSCILTAELLHQICIGMST